MTGWLDPGPYRRGLEYGRRLANYSPLIDHEQHLRDELALVGTTNRDHRAFALGELRGYRQAAGYPMPLYGHKVTA